MRISAKSGMAYAGSANDAKVKVSVMAHTRAGLPLMSVINSANESVNLFKKVIFVFSIFFVYILKNVYLLHVFLYFLFCIIMKKVCKKFVWLICALFLSAFMLACSVSADDDKVVFPTIPENKHFIYTLYPNDYVRNDSVSANLASCVRMVIHPNADYELSFEADVQSDVPQLQLFQLHGQTMILVKSIDPVVWKNRLVYTFNSDEKEMVSWYTTLSVDGEFYKGSVKNVKLVGKGSYSDHFSINLIAVGKIDKTADGLDLDSLAKLVLQMFRTYYTKVIVDTVYVRRAHEHPSLGAKYPKDEYWVAGESSEDILLSELGGWPENNVQNALDIILAHRLKVADVDGVLGYSNLFSGNLGGGPFSTLVVGEYFYKSEYEELALSSKEIIMTMIHETGHFFGLRHTTSTEDDFRNMGYDYSNYEDGMSGTPYCEWLLNSGLYKREGGFSAYPSDFAMPSYQVSLFATTMDNPMRIYDCPDVSNIMFPVTLSDVKVSPFTDEQLGVIRSSLMLFPH